MSLAQAAVYSAAVDGSDVRYLGQYGHVDGLTWSNQMPGGDLAMSCTLQSDPGSQPKALDPGRRLIVGAGGSIQWEGIMLQAVPGSGGWSVSGDGAGTWGTRFRMDYDSGGYTANNIIDRAIGRGLRWVRGNVSGGFMANPAPTSSTTITDFMNAITSPMSQTWRVSRQQAGLQVDLIPIPTTVTRLLITNTPAVRTLAGYINRLYARYQVTADANNVPAKFFDAVASNAASIAKHDVTEEFWDLSSAGIMNGTTALNDATAALAKYIAASYGGPFTVSPGQYLTTGGAPVDLACETAGEVCRLVLADGPYGGEVNVAPPIIFSVGQVQYTEASQTLAVTPFQAWNGDFGNLLNLVAPKAAA
jgi:hypothetical protein